jgi:hypothetical protein
METRAIRRGDGSKIPVRRVKTAPRTANSAGSGLIFMRISGFRDNPVKYTDPDGRIIGINGDEESASNIVTQINELSYVQYKAEKIGDGAYVLVKTGGINRDGSRKYSNEINKSITDDSLVNIRLSDPNSFGEAFQMEYYGHGYTGIVQLSDNGLYKEAVVVSVDLKSSSFLNQEGTRVSADAAEVLMHELVTHAFPLSMNKGNDSSLRNENIIRKQLGLQLRPADRTHRLK